MKLKLLATSFLFCLIVLSCCDLVFQSNDKRYFDNFDYALTDDVSPVKITFTAEGDWKTTEWLVDTRYSNEIDNNSGYVIFDKPGYFPVKFRGIKKGLEYTGDKTVRIPPKATKIKILGFKAKDILEGANLEDKSFTAEADYYNSQNYKSKATSLKLNNAYQNDTVFFDEPVLFFIKGFDDPEKSDQIYINFSLREPNETLNKNDTFQGSFYINTAYLSDRFLYDGKILLSNGNEEAKLKKLFLIVDWMP